MKRRLVYSLTVLIQLIFVSVMLSATTPHFPVQVDTNGTLLAPPAAVFRAQNFGTMAGANTNDFQPHSSYLDQWSLIPTNALGSALGYVPQPSSSLLSNVTSIVTSNANVFQPHSAYLDSWSLIPPFSTNGLQGALGYTPQPSSSLLSNATSIVTSNASAFDAAGAAQKATNGLGSAAFTSANSYLPLHGTADNASALNWSDGSGALVQTLNGLQIADADGSHLGITGGGMVMVWNPVSAMSAFSLRDINNVELAGLTGTGTFFGNGTGISNNVGNLVTFQNTSFGITNNSYIASAHIFNSANYGTLTNVAGIYQGGIYLPGPFNLDSSFGGDGLIQWFSPNSGFPNVNSGTLGFITTWWHWGGVNNQPYMQLGSANIRLEEGWYLNGSQVGQIMLGNEASAGDVIINHLWTSFSGAEIKGSTTSKPFVLENEYYDGTNPHFTGPGFIGQNFGYTAVNGDPYTYGAGELYGYSLVPAIDSPQSPTIHNTPGIPIFEGRTNGFEIMGKLQLNRMMDVVTNNTTYTIDFDATPSVLDLRLFTNATFATANTGMKPGHPLDAMDSKIVYIHSGYSNRTLTFPSSWIVLSEAGTATAPTNLNAWSVLRIRLESFGGNDTNMYAEFATGNETPQLDSDAASFFSRAGIVASASTSNAVNQLVRDLKNYGWWSRLDVIYPFVGTNSSQDSYNLKSSSYTISWTNPGNGTFDITGVTGPTASHASGAVATFFGNTGYNPSTASNWNTNYCVSLVYVITNNTSASWSGGSDPEIWYGVADGSKLSAMGPHPSSGNDIMQIRMSNKGNTSDFTTPARWSATASGWSGCYAMFSTIWNGMGVYNGHNSEVFWDQGPALYVDGTTFTGVPNDVINLFGLKYSGDTVYYQSPAKIGAFAFGGAASEVSEIDIKQLVDIVDFFEMNMGRKPR